MPVVLVFLADAHWRYTTIGLVTTVGGLGGLLLQTPAGILADRIRRYRLLFAIASLLTGACLALLPLVPPSPAWIGALLFLNGIAGTLFVPTLAALALSLVGDLHLPRLMGENQGWNHAGNIFAALLAMYFLHRLGAHAAFASAAATSWLGAATMLLISRRELHEGRPTAPSGQSRTSVDVASWKLLLQDRRIWVLFLAVTLFHLANAPILPMTTLYVKKLGGSDSLATATVLTAQTVMIPMAWLAGRLAERWGRKPVLLLAFWILPARIVFYALAHRPAQVVVLQSLDGVGAGLFGVVLVLIAADITQGEGRFNTLLGMFATVQGIGGVLGPAVSGRLLDRIGFRWSFLCYAVLALQAATIVSFFLKETGPGQGNNRGTSLPA
jgi:MFS family permease